MAEEPEAQRALTGVIAGAQKEVEVVQPTGDSALLTGAGPFGLPNEIAPPAVGSAVGEGPHKAALMLRAGRLSDRGVKEMDLL